MSESKPSWPVRFLILALVLGPIILLVDCEWRVAYMIFWGEDAPAYCRITHAAAFAPPEPSETPDLITPTHIVPSWYMLPYHGVLRSVTAHLGTFDSKLLGVIAMYAALFAPFSLGFVDWSRAPTGTWIAVGIGGGLLVAIGGLAAQSLGPISLRLLQILVAGYFAIFLALIPLLALRRAPSD